MSFVVLQYASLMSHPLQENIGKRISQAFTRVNSASMASACDRQSAKAFLALFTFTKRLLK